MKSANDVARAFLLGNGVHLCARGHCDCIAELARIIENERAAAVERARIREHRLKLAKPRISEALAETREAVRKRA